MKLIFIRHGDPNYQLDTLTEKGWKEAELLSHRVASWPVTSFFVSPLGRAKDTANICLEKIGRKAQTLDWLREFTMILKDPISGEQHFTWDWMPDYWLRQSFFTNRQTWFKNPPFLGSEAESRYIEMAHEIDKILLSFGYKRSSEANESFDKNLDSAFTSIPLYNTNHKEGTSSSVSNEDTTLVFFCHFGTIAMVLSYLTGCSPMTYLHQFFCPTTSVTIISAEERIAGSAIFRCQVVGDTHHLLSAGEDVSASGFFTDMFSL